MAENQFSRMLRRSIASVKQRVMLMVSRGIIKLVDDSLKCQAVQVALLADELRDGVERWQDYGITAVPFTESEALFLSVGGDRSHGAVVCVQDRRHRPKNLVEGDVCLYTDKGERVYLNRVDDVVHLGAKAADDFLAKATETKSNDDALKTNIDTLRTAINGWTAVPTDGGAALKTALTAWLASVITLSEVKTEKIKGS